MQTTSSLDDALRFIDVILASADERLPVAIKSQTLHELISQDEIFAHAEEAGEMDKVVVWLLRHKENKSAFRMLESLSSDSLLLSAALQRAKRPSKDQIVAALRACAVLPMFTDEVRRPLPLIKDSPNRLAELSVLKNTVRQLLPNDTPFIDYASWMIAVQAYQIQDSSLHFDFMRTFTIRTPPDCHPKDGISNLREERHLLIAPEFLSNIDMALFVEAAVSIYSAGCTAPKTLISMLENRRGSFYLRFKAMIGKNLAFDKINENLKVRDFSLEVFQESMASVFSCETKSWFSDEPDGLAFFGGIRRTGEDVTILLPKTNFTLNLSDQIIEACAFAMTRPEFSA